MRGPSPSERRARQCLQLVDKYLNDLWLTRLPPVLASLVLLLARPCPPSLEPPSKPPTRDNSAWISPKETKQLPAKAIEAYLSDTGKKNGKLKEAYTIAKDPAEWEAEQEKRRANGDFDRDDDDEDVDMLDEDGEEKPAGSKKRKRSSAADKKTKEPASKAKKESSTASKKRKVRPYVFVFRFARY